MQISYLRFPGEHLRVLRERGARRDRTRVSRQRDRNSAQEEEKASQLVRGHPYMTSALRGLAQKKM